MWCRNSRAKCLYDNPAFFNGGLYTFAVATDGRRRRVIGTHLSGILNRTPGNFNYPGAAPTISANGTANAIVWTYDHPTNTLHAYRATNLTELWSGALDPTAKFVPITEANAKVYVGTSDALFIFGERSKPAA